jgi:UDP-glucuronate decarboxylase
MVAGLMTLMESHESVTGPINLGNPQEITVRELADKVIALTGSASRIVHMELPQDDPRRRRPDISRARLLLGWEPSTAVEDGLKATINYFETLQLKRDAG